MKTNPQIKYRYVVMVNWKYNFGGLLAIYGLKGKVAKQRQIIMSCEQRCSERPLGEVIDWGLSMKKTPDKIKSVLDK